MVDALRRVSVFFTRHWLKAVSLLIVVALMGYSFWLLKKMFITSSDFITWNMAVWGFALVINILPNISEVGFGNYILKLRTATVEANKVLDDLKRFSLEHYKIALKNIETSNGGFTHAGDDLVKMFWYLHSSIDQAGLKDELAHELKSAAGSLAILVHNGIKHNSVHSVDDLYEPSKLGENKEQSIFKIGTYEKLYEFVKS